MARTAFKMRKLDNLQVAALPLRRGPDGGLQVLLVTSRGTGRWVLPKGNLVKGIGPAEAAALEAHEEAGIAGDISPDPYGSFEYWKRRSDGFYLCHVDVFLLVVTREDDSWKEEAQRQREWVSFRRAFRMVLEPGLQSIFRNAASDDTVMDIVCRNGGRANPPDIGRAAAPVR